MMPASLAPDTLHADSFLFALRSRLQEATAEDAEDAYSGASAWTGFVFQALARAAQDCGMRSCAAKHALPQAEAWTRREHLFDVTWFRQDCGEWEPPLLILEHENQWNEGAFLVDFWKLLFGYAPVRVMIGYCRRAEDREPWVTKINDILGDEGRVRLPEGVEDVILLGHRWMKPSGYAVFRREGRRFARTTDSLDNIPMPDPRDATAWDTYVRRMQAAAGQRVHDEMERLRRMGIVDREGRVLTSTLPADMDPTSGASVVTG